MPLSPAHRPFRRCACRPSASCMHPNDPLLRNSASTEPFYACSQTMPGINAFQRSLSKAPDGDLGFLTQKATGMRRPDDPIRHSPLTGIHPTRTASAPACYRLPDASYSPLTGIPSLLRTPCSGHLIRRGGTAGHSPLTGIHPLRRPEQYVRSSAIPDVTVPDGIHPTPTSGNARYPQRIG